MVGGISVWVRVGVGAIVEVRGSVLLISGVGVGDGNKSRLETKPGIGSQEVTSKRRSRKKIGLRFLILFRFQAARTVLIILKLMDW